jgi:hypothetical protein
MSRFVPPINTLAVHPKAAVEQHDEFEFAGRNKPTPADGQPPYTGDYQSRFLYDRERLGPNWYYYNSQNLRYTENSLCHRSHLELKDMTGEWCLAVGCSHTEGIGLFYEDIWHQKLAQKLDMPVYSAGVGGGSNDMSFHNALTIITAMKNNPPKCLLFQVTDTARFMHPNVGVGDNTTYPISTAGSWTLLKIGPRPLAGAEDNNKWNALKEIIVAEDMLAISHLRLDLNLFQLSEICKAFGIKFLPFDTFSGGWKWRRSHVPLEPSDITEKWQTMSFLATEKMLPASWSEKEKQYRTLLGINHSVMHSMDKLMSEDELEKVLPRLNWVVARDLMHLGYGPHEECARILSETLKEMSGE